jgi:fructose transport system ATP-binding protein
MFDISMTIQAITRQVETLSGDPRRDLAFARAAALGPKAVIVGEPTGSPGVKESCRLPEPIRNVRAGGLAFIPIPHNMPHEQEVADRIHVHPIGRRLRVINPKDHSISAAVAFMTGAKRRDGLDADAA